MSTYKCLSSAWVCLVLSGLGTLLAQESAAPAAPEPRNWTTQEDHQDMMAQLGIRSSVRAPAATRTPPIMPITTRLRRIRFRTCRRS